ncbi:AraC family transcriptional regulator [Paenibacillus sp. GM2FR]|uniref:helix-turn-helix domain-containing protein n=1 Tax=Paenibacillus sp. GM2FR TaxID=2059268 RepID=UPI001FAECEA5|nr:AraC family transcriptional regulator [Paenibacillus sp. GM2FR]
MKGMEGYPLSLTLPALHVMGDITVNKGSVLGMRTIDDFELVFFPTGSRTVYENDRGEFLLDRPGIIFTCPGEPHRYRFDPFVPTRHLYVHFEYAAFRETFHEQGNSRGECQDWSVIAGGSLVPSLLKQMLKIVHVKPGGWQRRGAILLLSVLEEWRAIDEDDSRSSSTLPAPIIKALDYLEQHLHRQITIEEIAASSGWTHEHFTRMFVRWIGIPPQKALLERRLRRAEQLLIQAERTIKQIAYDVGFADEHYFSRMFKRTRGVTALEFRDRYADPLFRHLAMIEEEESAYPLNRHFVALNQERT